MWRGIARALVLALIWLAGTAGSAYGEDCRSGPPLVDVFVMYFGAGYWSATLCGDGAFRASDGGGTYAKQLTVDEVAHLRTLLAALPTGKKSYEFGVWFVDAPAMELSTQVGVVKRSYGIGASVRKERNNPAFRPVARLAIFMRGCFRSKHALSAEEWFAEAMPGRTE